MLPIGFIARHKLGGILASASLVTLVLAAPLGEASGGWTGSLFMPTMTMHAPAAGATGSHAGSASGAPGTITLSRPAAAGHGAGGASGALRTISLTRPAGAGSISEQVSGSLPTVTVSHAAGSPHIPANPTGALKTVTVDTPQGGASGGATPPTQAPKVVQAAYADGHSHDPQPTFATAPTVGNVVLTVIYGWSNPPATVNGWTLISGNASGIGLYYRYVQSGDTATYPSISTNNSAYTAAASIEISGVASTWSQVLDQVSVQFVSSPSGTSTTSAAMTSGAPNTLAVAWGFEYYAVFPPNCSMQAPFTADATGNGYFANAGAVGHNTYAASGSNVQMTMSWGTITPVNCGFAVITLIGNQQATAPTIAQSAAAYTNNGAPTPLSSAPTAGHLLVASAYVVNPANQSAPTAQNGWQLLKFTNVSAFESLCIFGRYAQSGDTASLPTPFPSSGYITNSVFWTINEIKGANATMGTAVPVSNIDVKNNASGTSTITQQTTTGPEQLALVHAVQATSGAAGPTVGSPWTQEAITSAYSADGVGSIYGETFVASASTVNATITWPATANGAISTILLSS